MKPVVGTGSCQIRHTGVVHSDRLHVQHEDGSEVEIDLGDSSVIEPGHDARVVGGDACVGFESESRSAEEYGRGD